jgi:hypothetical protein
MTVLQVQSLPVLAHQHRTIIFFAFLLELQADWYESHWMELQSMLLSLEQVVMMMRRMSVGLSRHSSCKNIRRHNDTTTYITNGSLGGVNDTACPRAWSDVNQGVCVQAYQHSIWQATAYR